MTLEIVLAGVILILTVYAWLSAFVLIRVARHRPRVGSLTERAVVAVFIAIFGTVYSVNMLNTQFLHILDMTGAIVVVRIAVMFLLTIPAWWSWMLVTGRLTRTGDEP
jgi:hypothetical protein